jgi:translation initiation factor IF-3
LKNLHRINREIKSPQVRLIDETGTHLGIFDISEALTIAFNRGLDLVEVSPNANPPVCKIMDYSKYKYELQKKEQMAKKLHKKIEVKELRLHISISPHDLQTKIRRAREFLSDGNKVKFRVIFRGRENAFTNKGEELLNKCIEYLKDISIIEKPVTLERNVMEVVIVPNRMGKGGSGGEVKNPQGGSQASKNNSVGQDKV